MQKQTPTAGKLALMAGFALSCFGLLLYMWLAFGGPIPLQPQGYRFSTTFDEAVQLAKEAEVRTSGVPIGRVTEIEPGDDGRTRAIIEMEAEYAPIAKDARAMLRQRTLLGETYVEITAGNPERAGTLEENGELPSGRVAPSVELDEIFRAFDQRTRNAFRTWISSQAQALEGRGPEINDALGNLAPFAEDTNQLLRILNSQERAVRRLVSNTGEVFAALTERDGQLRGLIENSNTVFETTAQRDEQLQEVFRVLPSFQRETRTTVARLTEFSQDTDPLVTQLRPAARELSPTLQDLGALAPDLEALFRDLDLVITASRAGLPALNQTLDDLRPVLGQVDPFLRHLNPVLHGLGVFREELTSFFANPVASTQATDIPPGSTEPVHYLRTMNPQNPENLAMYPQRIGSNRPNPYVFPQHFRQIRQGLPVFEDRHCGRGAPVLSDAAAEGLPLPNLPGLPEGTTTTDLVGLLSPELRENIQQVVFGAGPGGVVPAPPCRKQPQFPTLGEPQRLADYPQVRPEGPLSARRGQEQPADRDRAGRPGPGRRQPAFTGQAGRGR
jgi:phospholipid/cholesterol/gamma-HCH transport system substrate-binding protein